VSADGWKCAGLALILKELFSIKYPQFYVFCGYFRERFIDSKGVKWRKFGEKPSFFLFNYFSSIKRPVSGVNGVSGERWRSSWPLRRGCRFELFWIDPDTSSSVEILRK
jgi:hypothetical protein